MIRIIGAVFIFIGSLYAGISMSRRCRMRIVQLKAFYEFISYISRQIDGYLTPLDKIYAAFESPVLERCGYIQAMRKTDAAKAFLQCQSRLFFKKSEADEIYAFLENLGRNSAADESKRCAYFVKRMEELAESAQNGASGEIRMYRAFGILGGVLLIVILL